MLWEILKASKGLPVDDLFAALWGKKIAAANDWQLTTLTGTLPLTFQSKGTPLTDYKFYGTAEGAGVETENLFDGTIVQGGWKVSIGNPPVKYGNTARLRCDTMFSVPSIGTYTLAVFPSSYKISVLKCDSTGNVISDTGWSTNNYHTLTGFEKGVFVIKNANGTNISPSNIEGVYVVEGSTTLETFIPAGYKLQLTVESGEESTTTPIYIGSSKLYEDEYVDYQEQKIYRTILLTTHDNKDFITSDNKRFCVRRSNNA